MTAIKARPYGPESTVEERNALRERVYFYSGNIIIWKEVPVVTGFQTKIFCEKLNEITSKLEKFYLLVDLSDAGLPDFAVMRELRTMLSECKNLSYISIFTEKNLFMNTATRVLLDKIGFKKYSIHKTMEQALKTLNELKNSQSHTCEEN